MQYVDTPQSWTGFYGKGFCFREQYGILFVKAGFPLPVEAKAKENR